MTRTVSETREVHSDRTAIIAGVTQPWPNSATRRGACVCVCASVSRHSGRCDGVCSRGGPGGRAAPASPGVTQTLCRFLIRK
eukprot:169348-Hanusia_phi.AAC.1